jgi:Uma2 family endonuclease
MSRRPTVRYTYQDYLAIPEDPARRHEIVDGELHVSAAPRFRHQEVVTNLAEVLRGVVRRERTGAVVAGPVTMRLHDQLVLEPDVVFVRRDRLDIVDPGAGIHGPPDVVVEVLSPGTRDYDRGLKRKLYLENGVPEVWIVDADERTLEVWREGWEAPLSRRAPQEVEWQVSGRTFRLDLARIFEETGSHPDAGDAG